MNVHNNQKILRAAAMPLVFIGQGDFGRAYYAEDFDGSTPENPGHGFPGPRRLSRLTWDVVGANADGDRYERRSVIGDDGGGDEEDAGAGDPGGAGGGGQTPGGVKDEGNEWIPVMAVVGVVMFILGVLASAAL